MHITCLQALQGRHPNISGKQCKFEKECAKRISYTHCEQELLLEIWAPVFIVFISVHEVVIPHLYSVPQFEKCCSSIALYGGQNRCPSTLENAVFLHSHSQHFWHQTYGVFSHTEQLHTSSQVSTTQFNSDTNLSQSWSHKLRAQCHKIVPTSDASHKQQVPRSAIASVQFGYILEVPTIPAFILMIC